jgi:N-acetylglucosaminyldiphosphoundecaprenol N-acetyl-beta-D-mannosaminyltransferase
VIDRGKKNVVGVLVDVVDYDAAGERIVAAARSGTPFACTALAVHGVMTGAGSREQRHRLNNFDLVVPDGQPVRWALNLLYRAGLSNQVRGTTLTLDVLRRAEAEGLPVFFYGSTQPVLDAIVGRVQGDFASLRIAGAEPSKFRAVDAAEGAEIAKRINGSGARIVFVGLGCPRQEMFVSDLRGLVDGPMLAVGAAFDYLAGTLREPPDRMRRMGLEWLWRLYLEPRRLWRRYVLLNPAYLALIAGQAIGVWRPRADGTPPEPGQPTPA